MQFRKKPVVIDASQWFKHGDHPVVTELPANRRLEGCAYDDACGWVPTLEGGHVVTPGDWIITGIKGEHYPCKPDIFDETYECAPDPLPVELQHAAAQRGFEHEAACDRALTGAQPAPAAPSDGPWSVSSDGRHLYSDDFTHDVKLVIDGDFADVAQRRVYADMLAARLTAAQPADSAMEVLWELVACKATEARLRELHAMGHGTDYDQHGRQFAAAWDRARALVAKETPHAR